MEPFVHLREYPFVICKSCQFACVANEVYSHLRKHHPGIQIDKRRKIVAAVAAIPGIIHRQAELQEFQLPESVAEPVLFIWPPKEDGMRCKACRCIYRQPWRMLEHGRKAHGWENDWKKGGDVVRKAKERREVPWMKDVRCQRFFPSRAASGYFEVIWVGEASEGSSGQQPGAAEDMAKRIRQMHRSQEEKLEKKRQARIRVADEKKEPNPWLERTGWARHLEGLNPEKLRDAAGPITDEETVLQGMVGLAALFEIQSKEVRVKPNRPFDNRLEDDTWERYKDVWRKLLCILQRTQTWDDIDSRRTG
ncbi:hypothetical protein V8C42DRAFT_356318 [Trichoderma barbatum]